jgi:hypothetical protein
VVHTWKIGVDNGNNPNLSMLISNGLSTDPKKLPVRQIPTFERRIGEVLARRPQARR